MRLLAPMRIEQFLGIVLGEPPDQPLKRFVRTRVNRPIQRPKPFGQIVRRQRESCDHAERPAAPSFQRPEQVRLARCVDDANCAVGGYDFGFEQNRRRQTVTLREAAEAASEDETANADVGPTPRVEHSVSRPRQLDRRAAICNRPQAM